MATTLRKPPASKAIVHKPSAGHLSATVPDMSIAKRYISRTVNGVVDYEILDAAMEHHMNVLIEGPTGPGKTMFSRAYAASRKRPFYRLPSNVGFDPSQFFGRYVPDGKGSYVWIDGPVTVLAKHGGILLVNEINFLPDRVATVLFGLLDDSREIILLDHENEVVKAHPELLIVADMNPDYQGTRQLNAALRNRFEVQLFWDYDPEVEKQLIKSPVLRELIIDLRKSVASDVFRTPISTNMAMELEKVCGVLGYDFAVNNFVNHFAEDEREAVGRIFEASRDKLAKTMPKPKETEEQKTLRRSRMKQGDFDPEFGVLGTDWIWDEDDEEDLEAIDNDNN
ncbi:MAG: MoxR family ATPase [Rhizobiaceae bacterium]